MAGATNTPILQHVGGDCNLVCISLGCVVFLDTLSANYPNSASWKLSKNRHIR